MGMGGEGGDAPVPVDVGTVLQRSWDIFTQNIGLSIGVFVLMMVVTIPFVVVAGGLAAIGDTMEDETLRVLLQLGAAGVYLVAFPVVFIPYLGSIRVFTRLARGLPASFGMMVSEVGRFPAALLSVIAMAIAVMFGYAMCIVPGVLLALSLQYAPYLMIDLERGPIESLSEAWSLAFPHLLTVFLLELALGIGGLVAVCATCGLGYFVVVPVTLIARAVLYHAMLGAAGRA